MPQATHSTGQPAWPRVSSGLAGLCLGLCLAWPALAGAPKNPIAGVRFEPQVQLGGQSLQLNGTGLRAVAWFKGYAAALYLPQRSEQVAQVVASRGAKRLQMRLLVDVPVEEFVKAFHKGVERNTPADQHAGLQARMARFDALLRPLGTVKKGDTVNLDLLPGSGMQFWHNGRLLGPAIEGDDFYSALLLIFIGDRPVDDALKSGLLGRGT